MKGHRFIPLVVVAAGLLAYHNSFTGAFVFDDLRSIRENPTIRRLWPIWACLSPPHRGGLTVEGRPLINLSLAVSYAFGGYNVWGYHALNLTVHILAGLTLLGIVRRTLRQPRLGDRFGGAADELALAAAVLWTVHPLNTESVTYVIQRAESMMGLFYLLTLYCFIRGAESPPRGDGKWFVGNGSWRGLWYGLSVAACALGMVSKEVMVSAPILALLYDRAFLSGSFREAWRRRGLFYLGLAGTWILLGSVLIAAGSFATASMNARRIGLTRWVYLRTQPEVILYYLRLSVWPKPLSLDHAWPMARSWMSILPSAIVIVFLLGATAWAVRINSVYGFVGAWFFLILAPSSSIIPLHGAIYEHRMYLSLAAVVSMVVLGLYSLLGRRSLVVFALMAIALGILTWRRNQDYRSEVILWQDAAAKFPQSPSVHYNLGVALWREGRAREAIAQYEQVLRLNPDNLEEVHNNLGLALWKEGRVQEAIGHWEEALRLKPEYADPHYNLGLALAQTGNFNAAISQFQEALRSRPNDAEAHNNLGNAFIQVGRVPEAMEQYDQALRIKPDFADPHYNLGVAFERTGRVPEAMEQYEQALQIDPDFTKAQQGLARLRATQ
ncbi:MAG TPA: tetratricopeptide repeat protein [Verrucomicrobiae bacterium]|nr:tetratricopeptide repeat protein [Verrucomicrobiae bacterium]